MSRRDGAASAPEIWDRTEAGAEPGMPDGYGGLQILFPEEGEIDGARRLYAAVRPLLSWYRQNRRDLPWRRDRDPYRIWISEIMLQQTRVEAVKPYFARFMDMFPSVPDLAMAEDDALMKAFEGLGYYSRARNLKAAARVMTERFSGSLPASFAKLLALPGIGTYTAGAIASIAFGIPVPAVDGNVLRVLSRVIGSREDILKQSTKRRMEALAAGAIPAGEAGDFNQALIEVGAVVCVPNGVPLCGECPFFSVCAARQEGLISEIPVKTPKKKRKIEEITVLLLEYKDKIAIRKRDGAGLLASLYEFPNMPGSLSEEEAAGLAGPGAKALRLPDARHIFSHVEWHMTGYLISLARAPEPGPCGEILFVEFEELKKRYPIPSAFIKYKKLLEQRYGGGCL